MRNLGVVHELWPESLGVTVCRAKSSLGFIWDVICFGTEKGQEL